MLLANEFAVWLRFAAVQVCCVEQWLFVSAEMFEDEVDDDDEDEAASSSSCFFFLTSFNRASSLTSCRNLG